MYQLMLSSQIKWTIYLSIHQFNSYSSFSIFLHRSLYDDNLFVSFQHYFKLNIFTSSSPEGCKFKYLVFDLTRKVAFDLIFDLTSNSDFSNIKYKLWKTVFDLVFDFMPNIFDFKLFEFYYLIFQIQIPNIWELFESIFSTKNHIFLYLFHATNLKFIALKILFCLSLQ